jgi:hypothetical protein
MAEVFRLPGDAVLSMGPGVRRDDEVREILVLQSDMQKAW